MSLYEHFTQLLELSQAQQSSYLNNIADDDVRIQLQAMLAEHIQIDESTDWHNLVAQQINHITGDSQLEDLTGTQVGPYQLSHIIGQGGMGVVYQAKRNDGTLKQNVAIKFLMPSVMRVIGNNFAHNEAQILASLNHPNITKVFDAGTTQNGLSYFVMELIDGIPIDEYCQNTSCTIDDIIRLFLDVADAISSAHLLNVVHTDIKPANVLVTSDGVVKVLDFGIAKLIHNENQDSKALQNYLQAMSLSYASPEQLKGEKLTLATDQYSLAVLLYQLLTNTLPYQEEGNTRQQLIQAKLTTPAPPLKAQLKGVNARLRISGDLEYVIAKALSLSVAERYQSVKAMQSELHRVIRHLPLYDKKHSYVYRFKKWLLRSPAQAAVVASLSIFAISFYLQNLQIEEQKKTAEQVAEQMINIFKMANPTQGYSPELSAKDILLQGAKHIEQDTQISFSAKTKLMVNIAQSLVGLGYDTHALPILKSWAKNTEVKNEYPRLYFKANRLLAHSLRRVGDKNASYQLTKALLTDQDLLKPSLEETYKAYINLASLGINHLGQAGIAEFNTLFQGSASLEKESPQYWSMKVAELDSLISDADALYFYGHIDFSAFKVKQREIVTLLNDIDKHIPHTHPDYISFLATKAQMGIETGTPCSDCQERVLKYIPHLEQKLGNDHRDVDFAYRMLSYIKKLEHDYTGSVTVQKKVLAMRKARYSEKSIEYLEAYLNLASEYDNIGHIEQADNMRLYAYQLFHSLTGDMQRTELNIGYYHALNNAISSWEAIDQMDKAYSYILEAEALLHADPIFQLTNDFKIQNLLMTSRKNYILYGAAYNIEYLQSQKENFSFPNDFELNFELARMYYFNGQPKESLPHIKQAIKAVKKYEKTTPTFYHQYLGPQYLKALAGAGEKQQAQEIFNRVYLFNYRVNPSITNHWLTLLEDIAKKYHLSVPKRPKHSAA